MNAPFSPQSAARALGGEVIGRDKVRAPSPGNHPTDRSLELRFGPELPDGFTACSYYGDVDWKDAKDYVRSKMGTPWAPKPKNDPIQKIQARDKRKAGKIVETYDYRDHDGTLLYQVVRYDPKNFKQRRPGGNGEWIWEHAKRHVLYRWADLIKFPDATVFVCEGEKDANRVASLGHCATTIDGRGKWTADCIDALKVRHVFILEDNDKPGGSRAFKAAKALYGAAASLRVVRLPGLVDGGDVSDWLDADPTRAETLVDLCLSAPEWEPTADESTDENEPEEDEPAETEAAIYATPYVWKQPETIPLREWLYGYQLIRKFVSGTVSPGGVGKSSLIAVEALAMVSGEDLLETLPKGKLRVWLWNLEDPQEETERKIQAAALHYNLSPQDIGDRLFVDSGRDQPLVIATATRTGTLIARPVSDALVAEIIARKIDVLIIDPFVSCHEVAENDNQAMDMIVKEWGKIADRGNCAVHLVHHTPKMAGAEVTAEHARGGKAFADACRVVRAINRMTKEEGEKIGVENHRLYFRTLNDKANLQPPADSSDWFKLQGVDLGNGHLGGPGDSVGVVTTWEWPDPLAGMTGADFDKVAAVIKGGKWRENVQAKDWVGGAVAKALDLNINRKPDRAKANGMIKAWMSAGSLVVVEGEDEKRMPRKFVEVREDI